ncbi:RRXRR domain-containing protein [Streptomyces sp. S.PB5]|uniref:RRXRR domain-containing protein n=1 Tax=Streptomyces sp. S.PB5 TaxID=3020844 RepID=UPI0025B20B18|nr:RRXRR domain-containing protein [Streptomyces sp. S.PB5]MDN3023336.1 RRXRR domain-containing protein [Streptomyces sp. S.PB5]
MWRCGSLRRWIWRGLHGGEVSAGPKAGDVSSGSAPRDSRLAARSGARSRTHQAVLPQQPALESVGADTPGSRDETAHGHPALARGTGREHGRGETDGPSTGARRRHAEAENGSGDAPTQNQSYTGEGAVITVRRGLVSVELQHRGDHIHLCMQQRAGYRHRRRSANCRYRAPRSNNRTRPAGWLPPSFATRPAYP